MKKCELCKCFKAITDIFNVSEIHTFIFGNPKFIVLSSTFIFKCDILIKYKAEVYRIKYIYYCILNLNFQDAHFRKRERQLIKKEKMRSSNIELLRSVAMLMIISFHIVYHCVNIQLTDRGSMERLANGLFNYPVFYKKLMILDTLNTFGITGNVIFILISGYFMVQKGGY